MAKGFTNQSEAQADAYARLLPHFQEGKVSQTRAAEILGQSRQAWSDLIGKEATEYAASNGWISTRGGGGKRTTRKAVAPTNDLELAFLAFQADGGELPEGLADALSRFAPDAAQALDHAENNAWKAAAFNAADKAAAALQKALTTYLNKRTPWDYSAFHTTSEPEGEAEAEDITYRPIIEIGATATGWTVRVRTTETPWASEAHAVPPEEPAEDTTEEPAKE